MKTVLISSILLSSSCFAAVQIQFSFLDLLDISGVPVDESVFVLVADTGNDGFTGDYITGSVELTAFDNSSLTTDTFLKSNDFILYSGLVSAGEASGITASFELADIPAATGQQLALYWFPGISGTTITGSVVQYGFFRSATSDDFSDLPTPWTMPGDGLWALAADSLGDTPQSALQAIPEPSTYVALFGVLALGAVVMRRRNRR